MHTIQSLASITAERARACGMRPNGVVRMVLRELQLPEDLSTDILRECGRRGGKSRRSRNLSEATKRAITLEYTKIRFEIDMYLRGESANEHLCPVFP